MKFLDKEFWDLVTIFLSQKPLHVPEDVLFSKNPLASLVDEGFLEVVSAKYFHDDQLRTWDTSYSLLGVEITALILTTKAKTYLEEVRSKELDSLEIDTRHGVNYIRNLISYQAGNLIIKASPLQQSLEYLNLISVNSDEKFYLTPRGIELIKLLIGQEPEIVCTVLELEVTLEASDRESFLNTLLSFIPKYEWPVILSKLPATAAIFYGDLLRKKL